jgi:hypothetical protein
MVEEHIQLSLVSGGTEKLRKSVASAGVRDSATTSIVETLLELGKQLRKRVTGVQPMPENEIQERLKKKLDELLHGKSVQDVINPLLGMKGLFDT